MKAYNRIFAAVITAMVLLTFAANIILTADSSDSGRPYRVEINRLASRMEAEGPENIDLSQCKYVTGVEKCVGAFDNPRSDYAFREINGVLYRFDYRTDKGSGSPSPIAAVNMVLGIWTVLITGLLLYIKFKILAPFEQLAEVPRQLSKGNLTAPIKETENRFFGKFIWGVELLREHMEQQKKRELDLQRERKLLLLSLSHDIKTPLSAIKLYARALSRGLYESPEKQIEIAESIGAKADEIESYIAQITAASREDFLSLEVAMGEFFLSALAAEIKRYYSEKLSLIRTDFTMSEYSDCLLSGDFDRSVEVLQNIMENAVKYGDGKSIAMNFSKEEDCILITVENSGCTLSDTELPHIFESFWRGANAERVSGSGLGLYISRKLMQKMKGEIFAEIKDGFMRVTAVFTKA